MHATNMLPDLGTTSVPFSKIFSINNHPPVASTFGIPLSGTTGDKSGITKR